MSHGDQLLVALADDIPGDPRPKKQRLGLGVSGRFRRQFRTAVLQMAGELQAQRDPEVRSSRMKNFQTQVGKTFLELMAKEKDLDVKQGLREEFDWLISADFIEYFSKFWKESAD